MKKFNLWLLLSLFVAAFAMSACSSSDDATSGGGGGDEPTPPVAPTTAAVTGVVYHWGSPMSGVKVTVGASSVTTGYNGVFSFDQVSGSVVKFEKEGYATITRAISGDNAIMDVTMTEVQTQTFSASAGSNLSIWSGGKNMKVELPTSYTDANGNAYTGNVTAKAAYLNPENYDFADAMPGDLTAIRNDENKSEVALVSYGMISVELTGDNGEKLQPGAPATLTFPVDPTKMKVAPQNGETMPLWSFNEETGLWEEEGVATYDASLQAYVGTVNHFSWHNLDYPEARATLKAKVVDKAGNPVVGIPVDFDGQRTAYTNAEGVASCVVPRNTDLVIKVKSEAYGNYVSGEIQEVKQNVNLGNSESGSITLTMPSKAPVISGTVTNEGSGSSLCTLWIEYDNGMQTSRVVTNLVGGYSIIAPASYRGAAKIYVMLGDGSKTEQAIEITDADQTVNITINSSAPAGAGIIVVAGAGLNTWYELSDGNNGVWDGEVTIDSQGLAARIDFGGENKNQGWGSLNINIPDYEEGKTTYTSSTNNFHYMLEGMGGWTQIDCSDAESTVVVTKNGDIYSFKFNGTGTLIDRSLGMDWDTALPVSVATEFSVKNTSTPSTLE